MTLASSSELVAEQGASSWGRSTDPSRRPPRPPGLGSFWYTRTLGETSEAKRSECVHIKLFALLDGDDFHDLNGSFGELAVHDPICRAGPARLIEIQLETVGEVASAAHVFQPGSA